MKYLFLLLLFPITCQAQKPKKKTYALHYCNSDSVKKWEKEHLEGFMYNGLSSFIIHKGIYYEDTSVRPPAIRMHNIGDTSIASVTQSQQAIVLYITECDSCPIKKFPAYKNIFHTTYYNYALYEDRITHIHYSGGFGISGHSILDRVEYYDRNKKPLPSSTKTWGECNN